METISHFNSIFKKSKYGWHMTRETYMPNLTNSTRNLFENEQEINDYIKDCLENFDLNIEFFNKLNKEEFNNQINSFLSNNSEFNELFNLDETKEMSGYYIMILDNYKQIYIGTGKNIYKRLRRHMSENQEFCNLLWGNTYTSKLSINSFRPLDTTRIFVYYTDDIYNNEDRYINNFSEKFVLNRTGGGIQYLGIEDVVSKAKYRKLK